MIHALLFLAQKQKLVNVIYTGFEIEKKKKRIPIPIYFFPSSLFLAEPHVNVLAYVMPYANRFKESFLLLIIQVRIFTGHCFYISACMLFLGTRATEMSALWAGGPSVGLASQVTDLIVAAFPIASK